MGTGEGNWSRPLQIDSRQNQALQSAAIASRPHALAQDLGCVSWPYICDLVRCLLSNGWLKRVITLKHAQITWLSCVHKPKRSSCPCDYGLIRIAKDALSHGLDPVTTSVIYHDCPIMTLEWTEITLSAIRVDNLSWLSNHDIRVDKKHCVIRVDKIEVRDNDTCWPLLQLLFMWIACSNGIHWCDSHPSLNSQPNKFWCKKLWKQIDVRNTMEMEAAKSIPENWTLNTQLESLQTFPHLCAKNMCTGYSCYVVYKTCNLLATFGVNPGLFLGYHKSTALGK